MPQHRTRTGPDWECVTRQAPWLPRDSQGEFVHDDHLWILGGWFSPTTTGPRDVWKSPDGARWTCTVEEAPWEYGDLPATLSYGGRMWVMGGRRMPGAANCNQVWSSADGANWTLVNASAGWCPRVSPSFAVFRDRMWILAGTENFYEDTGDTLKNDVWSSADGRDWRLETRRAEWPKRTHAQAAVFAGRLWILGGGAWRPRTIPRNDVWCSEDGVRWTCVTGAAPWRPRIWFSVVVYRGCMWVLGGWNREDGNLGDVWYSRDGAQWTEVKSSVIWSPRHEHSAWVLRDRIWVAGGYGEELDSEVWSLRVPEDFPPD